MSEQSERRYPVEPRAPNVLAVDIGGSHVKAVLHTASTSGAKFPSGPRSPRSRWSTACSR